MDTRTRRVEGVLAAGRVAAGQAAGDERATSRPLARLGAAALGGAVVLFVSTLLHPLDSDPNAP